MTILQALVARHDRTGDGSSPGYATAQISFAIVLGGDGGIVDVEDLRSGDKRRRPMSLIVPAPPKRTVAIQSGTFWDKTSYVLGCTRVDPAAAPNRQARELERTGREHAAFRALHEKRLAETDDEGCAALLAFIRGWTPDRYGSLPLAEEMLDQNVVFRLEGELRYVHDRPAARRIVAAAVTAAEGPIGTCLVTGLEAPIARLHGSIKGVFGAQSSGAALVSFNRLAFNSFGKLQGANAPVSQYAVAAYTTALNALLSASRGTDPKSGRPLWRNRIGLGDDTVVFWADTSEAEDLVGGLFSPDDATETDRVRTILDEMAEGRPIREATPGVDPSTRVYVLGLSPNAARLSVRFWLDHSLGDLARRFQDHWSDMRIEPAARRRPPPVWALLHELAAQRKAENVPKHLAGEVTRAILTGGRYPAALLSQTLMRIRSDQDRKEPGGRVLERVSPLRISILKACLARDARRRRASGEDCMEVPVSLDLESTNPAYRLGRLFALLEQLQRAALGLRNATIRDRFYAAASATPGIVFPSLIRNARNHSKKIRARRIGIAEWFEDQIGAIADGLRVFPKSFAMQDQGRFALGYYHQREALRQRKGATPADLGEAENEADNDEEG